MRDHIPKLYLTYFHNRPLFYFAQFLSLIAPNRIMLPYLFRSYLCCYFMKLHYFIFSEFYTLYDMSLHSQVGIEEGLQCFCLPSCC